MGSVKSGDRTRGARRKPRPNAGRPVAKHSFRVGDKILLHEIDKTTGQHTMIGELATVTELTRTKIVIETHTIKYLFGY